MATTPAAHDYVVDEEELMALKSLAELAEAEEADAINRDTAAFVGALMRRVADLEAAGNSSPEDLAWAEYTEADVVQTAEEMASMAEDILQGAAVLEARPGEDVAAMPELRRQAAQASAIAAEAGRVAAATRRLVENETRRLATLEHVVDPDVMGMLRRVADLMEMDAASPEEVAAAAGAAERVEADMVRLRVWLILAARRAAERHGEAALAAALRMQAGKVKAAVATVNAFRESISRYQAAGALPGHARVRSAMASDGILLFGSSEQFDLSAM